MAFFVTSSPHIAKHRSTTQMMLWVMLAAIPGLLAQLYFFGWGTAIQLIWALLLVVIFESLVMVLRKRSPKAALRDGSALLTGWLLAVAIPPLAPWWILVIGLFFAIVIAKHLYGGLGNNLFNPAMVGYVVLLISFPLQMTSWLSPTSIMPVDYSFADALQLIFTGFDGNGFSLQQLRTGVDGVSMATPLDTFKTDLANQMLSQEIKASPIFGSLAGLGWEWINLLYLAGGLLLIQQKVIQWYIPVAMLASLFVFSTIGMIANPDASVSPIMHLLSGATMLGAFFIATDPVSAATTVRGRIVFGAFVGAMVYIIRTWGGYPDGVAFAVLLANMCVPLIDYYTRPKTYGH
ncbi:electron transporter RnfD [Vibrio sp. qd031]|uniref:electron transport complex subunit RsxD n=1 Tax=Vibrio sp. qd031 TaxID=1603038 RepID=UPI000A1187A9|nr:electron transport complex subunit RsxD [Vibrio sp. qd031]ORT50197.1 electron transporter RnfD [Vibrio sp. qd031]